MAIFGSKNGCRVCLCALDDFAFFLFRTFNKTEWLKEISIKECNKFKND